ncbi:MAG: putative two-component system sensor kinase [Pedosphaera sp.]|nr:putative two-component system sensor kinase [Pedosphaera sp.]
MFHLFALIHASAGSLFADRSTSRARARPGVMDFALLLLAGLMLARATPANAVVLWNDPAATLAHETGVGIDILGGAVKRDDSANDTLYFKFHVDPLSDWSTEDYFAAFELYEGDAEHLGVGNALKAQAYSAFFSTEAASDTNKITTYVDLRSSRPESLTGNTSAKFQYPLRGVGVTVVFKVQYVPGEDDLVTVWLNPDLGPGATEVYQPETLITVFNAHATFDEIRLRHGGGGGGWSFSDMVIATAFSDFVDTSSARPSGATPNVGSSAHSFGFRSWQKENGLPQCPLLALGQTRDDYIWAGSQNGVARFDGSRFVSFGVREGLSVGPVRVLLGDSRGALWIGHVGSGLECWQNGLITTFTIRDGLPSSTITALAEDNDGHIWVGTASGLVLWRNGRLAPLSAADEFRNKPITTLFKDRKGNMWIGVAGAGVFQFLQGRMVPLTDGPLEVSLKDPHCLLVDQTGRIWIGAGSNLVLCCDGGQWHRYAIPRHLAKPFVNSLAQEGDGTIWAGSEGEGLLQFREGKFMAIPANAGLVGNPVQALLVSRDGKLWVGTDSGLNRLRRKSFFAFGQNEGLGFGAVHGLGEVAPGVIWAVKSSDGVYRWDGKNFSRLPAAGLSPRDSQVNTLLVTRDGACWVAGTNGLLRYKDPIAAADEVKWFELPNLNVISLAEDPDGGLCVGTREGKILRLREGAWKAQAKFSQTNAVTSLVPLAGGGLWIGTDGAGLYRLENGVLDHLDKAHGLLSDLIRTLYLDAQGVLWIGTAGGGLSRWHDGSLANFTTHDGLPDNTISQILEADDGRLWLGTGAGIACVSKHHLDEFADGKITTIYAQLFGRTEGISSDECTGGFYPAGAKTKSAFLWFSTTKGVVAVDPRAQPIATPMPNVVLEEVLVDGVSNPESQPLSPAVAARIEDAAAAEPKSQPLHIPPGKHRIEFHYAGLSFDAPELIRFRYRLKGLDADWVDAGGARSALYTYVPPGDYSFHVIACNTDGVWTDDGAGLSLRMLRHFWQTWWFIGFSLLGLMVSTGGVARFVVKKKLQQRLNSLEQERVLERERTRIAQDLHDEMGARLCRISFLSEHARSGNLGPEEVQNQIASISDASREVLHSLDEIVWAVNPRNDMLEHIASYIGQYAADYFHLTGIECEFDIPAQLPPHLLSSQTRHHLFLATHEALTNILKHSGATCAKISIKCSASTLEIGVSDNGKGIDQVTAEAKAAGPVDESHDGLRNMRRRLTDMRGDCRIESSPGHGTVIRFILPLNGLTRNNTEL